MNDRSVETDDFELFEAVYDAALNPINFKQFVEAWDKLFLEFDNEADALDRLGALEAKGLERHFLRAGHIFDAAATSATHCPKEYVERQKTAAFLATKEGRIIAANQMARSALAVTEESRLDSLPLYAGAHQQVGKALDKLTEYKGQAENSVALRGIRQDDQSVFVLVIELLKGDLFPALEEPIFLFKSTLTVWHEHVEAMLRSTFDLTTAEIEIVKLLNEGRTLTEISDFRERSLKTVRTQVKNIMKKTDTRSQTELMRHITSLVIVTESIANSHSENSPDMGNLKQAKHGIFTKADGREIHYIDQGADAGDVVLCVLPTSPPQLFEGLAEQAKAEGLRLISLYKPGAGRSTAIKKTLSMEEQVADYVHLIQQLKFRNITLFGQCAGGVLSLHIAKALPHLIKKVVMLDTGAPIEHQEQLFSMPAIARRTFFLARYSPKVLTIPHKMIARDFFSSPEGERRVVEYFYEEQGRDKYILNDVSIYEWAREMISYCLSDTEQLISDVHNWVSNWSALAKQIEKTIPITIIQGDENKQFPYDDVVDFCNRHDNINAVRASGAAQLTLVTHIDMVIDTLRAK